MGGKLLELLGFPWAAPPPSPVAPRPQEGQTRSTTSRAPKCPYYGNRPPRRAAKVILALWGPRRVGVMNAELPADFFEGVKDATATPSKGPRPSVAMRWYDGIIDDMLANPGTTVKDTALRLGRHPHTISAIIGSDLFKARWDQRREQFNRALDIHLTQKLSQVAEKALQHTITTLDKKQDSIPLPILKDLALGSLDRLGYGPSRSESPSVQVTVNSNTASAEALARAREKMRDLELKVVEPLPLPVAGSGAEDGEEG